MNSLRLALLGATFLVGAGAFSAANAADVYEKGGSLKDGPVDYRPAISWAGFYAGVHAGATLDDTLDLNVGDLSVLTGDVDDSFIGGIHVGYNWQRSNIVLGVEGTLSLVDDDITDYLASVRGRLGYAFDKSLVYATAGVAFLSYSEDEIVEGLFLDDDTTVGFVVGAGFEHKLTSNVSLGIEGAYYNFESDTSVSGVELERDFWTVQARLNYHFGGDRYSEPLK